MFRHIFAIFAVIPGMFLHWRKFLAWNWSFWNFMRRLCPGRVITAVPTPFTMRPIMCLQRFLKRKLTLVWAWNGSIYARLAGVH